MFICNGRFLLLIFASLNFRCSCSPCLGVCAVVVADCLHWFFIPYSFLSPANYLQGYCSLPLSLRPRSSCHFLPFQRDAGVVTPPGTRTHDARASARADKPCSSLSWRRRLYGNIGEIVAITWLFTLVEGKVLDCISCSKYRVSGRKWEVFKTCGLENYHPLY